MVAFTDRFLNSVETQNSVNKLEILGVLVVGAIENFEYDLNGQIFTIKTDHHLLLSRRKPSAVKKQCNSLLIRWVKRLLPFNFGTEQFPGARMGLVDYILRQPHLMAPNTFQNDKQFIIAKLELIEAINHPT